MSTSSNWSALCPDPFVPVEPAPAGSGFFLTGDRAIGIESGSVNLFVAPFDARTGQAVGTGLPIAEVEAGQLLFPVPVRFERDGTCHRLLAMPLPGTELRQSRAPWTDLVRRHEDALRPFDQFVSLLLTPFHRDMPPPRTRVITASDLESRGEFSWPAGTPFRPGQGVLWIQLHSGFCLLNGDEEQLLLAEGAAFPLVPQTWFLATDPAAVSARRTPDWLAAPDFPARFEAVFRQYLRAVLVAVAFRTQRRQRRRNLLIRHEHDVVRGVTARLRGLMQDAPSPAGPMESLAAVSPALSVIRRIARACGSTADLPVIPIESPPHPDAMSRRLEHANLFHRRIRLAGPWWKEEGPPLIAFRTDDRRPVALVHQRGQWWAFDPAEGEDRPLTPETAAAFEASALCVYPRLPSTPVRLRDVLKLAFRGLAPDLRTALGVGLLGGLVALTPSRITSTLFNTIIPTADSFQLFQMAVLLFSAAFAAALFELSRSLFMLRVKTRANDQLQAAVWGRLLNLPAGFFGRFSAGDLAQRVMGVDAMRAMLADHLSLAAMALLFALPNLGLMLYYNRVLAGAGLLILLLYAVLLAAIGALQYVNQREEYRRDGRLSGFALQAITGMAKIRMSISENRAFAKWARLFAEKVEWKSRSIRNRNTLAVLGSVFPAAAMGLFFLLIGTRWKGAGLNTGDYLAFHAAFTALAAAFTGFAAVIPSLLATFALYKRLEPVLDAAPEINDTQKSPGDMDGNVEMRNVTFRYHPDLPPVLRDITLHAAPGEFIAIVGPSGAGKSTIARLLLGLETPESGGMYYGGIDLATVNRRELRQKIGTVLQSGHLLQASIYDNIAGASGMSMDDAWEAARLAGCDADIRAMPMGMHTLVTNSAVSGGQRQRLLIARALARNPRIILFDEATSALDNETQAHVADSLERLNATRIVIAHRLSTIQRADRIYVLDAGRIVQTGTFDELLRQPGLFHRLAQRQQL